MLAGRRARRRDRPGPRARCPGHRARVRRGVAARPARRRDRLPRARHRRHRRPHREHGRAAGRARPDAAAGRELPEYAAQGEPKFPAYAAHMRRLHERMPRDAAAPRTRPGCRSTPAPMPAESWRTAWSRRGAGAARESAWPRPTRSAPARGGPVRGSVADSGLAEGDPADFVVYDADPLADLRVLAAPRRIVLRGRVVGLILLLAGARWPRSRRRGPRSIAGSGRPWHDGPPSTPRESLSTASARVPSIRPAASPRGRRSLHHLEHQEHPHPWPSRSSSSAWARSVRRTTASSSPTPAPSGTAGRSRRSASTTPRRTPRMEVNSERVAYWLGVGAQPTEPGRSRSSSAPATGRRSRASRLRRRSSCAKPKADEPTRPPWRCARGRRLEAVGQGRRRGRRSRAGPRRPTRPRRDDKAKGDDKAKAAEAPSRAAPRAPATERGR